MHTLKAILGGFLLLAVCLLAGRWIGGIVSAMKCFLVLWLIGTLINMWFGISKAGYSIKDEAPIALLIFIVPAVLAIVIWFRA